MSTPKFNANSNVNQYNVTDFCHIIFPYFETIFHLIDIIEQYILTLSDCVEAIRGWRQL